VKRSVELVEKNSNEGQHEEVGNDLEGQDSEYLDKPQS
jgi:hypothetical protein